MRYLLAVLVLVGVFASGCTADTAPATSPTTPIPTPNIAATVAAEVRAALAAIPSPTPNIAATVATEVQAALAAIPSPTPNIAATVAAEVQAALAAIPSPTPNIAATVAAEVQPALVAIPSPTPNIAATVAAEVQPALATIPSPTPSPSPTNTPLPTLTPSLTASPAPTPTPTVAPAPTPTRTPRPTATIGPTPTPTVYDVLRRVSPSLVRIRTPTSTGSGFIVKSDGGVVTSAHVVEGATGVYVTVRPGLELRGQVKGRDEFLDLAYIALQQNQLIFFPATMSDAVRVAPGAELMAFGFPAGNPSGIPPDVTRVFVSSVRTEGGVEWIQTDARLDPGSSGGVLIDRSGLVVGILTSRDDFDSVSGRRLEGVGVALSVWELRSRLQFLYEGGQALLPTPTR